MRNFTNVNFCVFCLKNSASSLDRISVISGLNNRLEIRSSKQCWMLKYFSQFIFIFGSFIICERLGFVFLKVKSFPLYTAYTPKNYHLFKVVENRMQQRCAAHIVHSCQQYCSALFSLNQPAIRCNNAEEYCWQLWTIWAAQHFYILFSTSLTTSDNFLPCKQDWTTCCSPHCSQFSTILRTY